MVHARLSTRFARLPAGILLAFLILIAPSLAEARTETLRWRHPNPSAVRGFRIHYGPSPRVYNRTIDVGLPAADASGVYSYALEVQGEAVIRVAVTAYGLGSPANESAYSNEKCRPRTAPECQGTAPPAEPPPAEPPPPASAGVLVPQGSTWLYADDGSNRGTAWRARNFADRSWKSGRAQLGYGDGDEATEVDSGPPTSRYTTTYFRKHFQVADPAAVESLVLRVLRDDGAVAYLNGQEVFRSGMPSGTINYRTPASRTIAGGEESTFVEQSLPAELLVPGDNVLAVEIHQSAGSSSDISFDAELSMGRPVTEPPAPPQGTIGAPGKPQLVSP